MTMRSSSGTLASHHRVAVRVLTGAHQLRSVFARGGDFRSGTVSERTADTRRQRGADRRVEQHLPDHVPVDMDATGNRKYSPLGKVRRTPTRRISISSAFMMRVAKSTMISVTTSTSSAMR